MIKVVSGIIKKNGNVLIAKRPEGKALAGFWEFPGGKIEAGEVAEESLERELEEELGIKAVVGKFIASTRFEYDFGVVELHFFEVSEWAGEIKNLEHSACKWVEPDQITRSELVPADIEILSLICES